MGYVLNVIKFCNGFHPTLPRSQTMAVDVQCLECVHYERWVSAASLVSMSVTRGYVAFIILHDDPPVKCLQSDKY